MAKRGHRQCATPGCTNIVSKKDRGKDAICSVCKRKLAEGETSPEVAEASVSLADRLTQLEDKVRK